MATIDMTHLNVWTSKSKMSTLWDIVKEHFLIHPLVTVLRQFGYADGGSRKLQESIEPEITLNVLANMEEAIPALVTLELVGSKNMVQDFINAIRRGNDFTGDEFAQRCFSCFKMIQSECEHVTCVRIDGEKPSEVDKLADLVSDKFPQAVAELKEAEWCLFYERGTACVFHSMRAVEVVLKSCYKTLREELPSLSDSWGNLLKPIDRQLLKPPVNPVAVWQENIDFFSEVVFDIRASKRAYRDSTMHVESVYTPDDAKAILSAVMTLVRHASSHLDQDGNFIA